MRNTSKTLAHSYLLASALSSPLVCAAGGIVTDGSMGAVQTLMGKQVTIPQSLGTTVGANLFHSFANFNIANGQRVTFSETTPNALNNIITRVTGDSRSTINGLLQATPAGHANFYLINPAGIVFGENASIDVPASFYVSTASELHFQNGGLFSATQPAVSTLTAQAPTAYGFLVDRSSDIQFLGNGTLDEQYLWHGTQLSVPAGSSLAVVAESVKVDATQLSSPQGSVRLIAQQGAGFIPVNALPKNATGGVIDITNSSLDVSGAGSGLLALRGGEVTVDNSQLWADNQGDSDALINKGVNIQASDLQLSKGTGMTADSYGKGRAGQVHIDVSHKLNILSGGYMSSTAWSEGNAGEVVVRAGQLTLDGQGSISSTAAPDSSGDAGRLNINADTLTIVNGSYISSPTFAQGDAGEVVVQAEQLTLDGQGSISSTAAPDSIGDAGRLTISANTLNIINGSYITSPTFAQGNAGLVSVVANNLSIDAKEATGFTGISTAIASSNSTGNAGQIKLHIADTLKISNGGAIQNVTRGTGNAGTIMLTAKHILLDGSGVNNVAAIDATAIAGSSGQTGNIRVQASDDIHLTNGARISTSNLASIAQPEHIHATLLAINSPILIMNSQSQITAESFGNIAASNIAINIAQWLSLDNALITTSASGSNGNGGNISLHSPVMVMATGFIQANAVAKQAQGGLVTIHVNALIPSGNHLISGGNQSYTFATGKFGDNVIQAAASEGLSGIVAISSPQLNLSGALASLRITPFDTRQLVEDFCATNPNSSLTRVGHGGILPKARNSLLINE